MAAPFAAYASQFLHRQQTAASSLSSSQPLFFSFTTDNDSRNLHDADLDDLDDPHLRASDMSRHTIGQSERRVQHVEDEDDDPYLRLDEAPGMSRYQAHSIPLLGSSSGEGSKGWLAHASPLRSPSPSPSSSSEDSSRPPLDILDPPLSPPPRPYRLPPPPTTAVAMSLTESLLPRDGLTRPMDVFSLPDPRYVPRGRRKYNDSIWTVLWCTSVSSCLFCCILLLFLTHKPTKRVTLPYTTLLHTVPLLTILICLSAAVSYAHIFLLRIFVKPVMVATSVFIPATLFISALWAFIGSFMWDGDQEPTWGETIGLRLFSIVPLVLSLLTARRLLTLPRDIHTASSLLTLTTRLLAANPFLLALSPAVLLAALITSVPFLTLIFRLLLIGYTSPHGTSGLEWHVHGWANWAIVGTLGVWLWTWGVARGIIRVACAGVIGAWYFADPSLPPPLPQSTHTIHAALFRATQPSLGSLVLSALILAAVRGLALLAIGLRALPMYLPPYLRFLSGAALYAVGYLENVTNTLSTYALAYVGLTGDPFFPSARRAQALTSAVDASLARYKRKFKTEPPLTMLTVAPLTLTFPFALLTYLFVAHTLNVPDQALGASLLAGGVTALVGMFCVGLVRDTADTLYICYCIDKDVGERRRPEVFDAFEYETHRRPAPPQPQASPPQPRYQSSAPTPPHPRPLPPLQPPVQPQPQRWTQSQRRHSLDPHQPSVIQQRPATPNPFEDSPVETEPQPYNAYKSPSPHSLSSSPSPPLREGAQLQPYSYTSERTDVSASLHASHLSGAPSDEESQMFPGSDLF